PESCIEDSMDRTDWNQRWQERGFHCHDDPSDVLEREIGSLEPGRALDLACGGGRNAFWLADRGWRVTAVDFSDVALAAARRGSREIDWVDADLRDYEPPAGSFE